MGGAGHTTEAPRCDFRGVLESEGFVLFHVVGGRSAPRFAYLSPSARELMGHAPAGRATHPLVVLRTLPPDDRRRLLRAVRQGFGSLVVRMEPSGTPPRNVHVVLRTHPAGSGGSPGWEVVGLARSCEPARAAAESGAGDSGPMRMKVAGLLHDLGNLLVPILGHTDLAAQRVPQQSPVGKGLRKIMAAATKAVEYMRAFEQSLDAAPDTAPPNTLDMQAMEALVRSLREILPAGVRLELSMSVHGSRPFLLGCDFRELDRALMNLCLNAAQAMDGRGRIRISVAFEETVPAGAVLDCSRAGTTGFARFTVHDDGPGLPPGSLRRLFDPFVSRRRGGRGLGLDVVKRFVGSVGGAVAVTTAPGQGTRFDLFVPATRRGPERAEPSGGRGALVVVDDDPSVLQITAEILEEAGWRVYAFRDGEEAIRFFREQEGAGVRVLITDVHLNTVTGLEITRAARSRYSGLPVVVITGDPLSPRCRKLLHTVPDVVLLRKPWRRSQLLDLIERLAGPRQGRK